ncbi:Signal recognition particle receptor FtsY [Coccomyxa sp. Obi]|nr:Signal recognition particle receptor FtsY [Coccomyxa sp. Obi]
MIERGLVDACSQASTSADIRCCDRATFSSHPLHSATRRRRGQRRTLLQPTVQAVSAGAGAGLLQKLGRVLREKAVTDLERITKGTNKTREKLGVVDELFSYWTLEDSEDTLEQLEDLLITADFGPKTALKVVDAIRDDIRSGRVKTRNDVRSRLKQSIVDVLNASGRSNDLQFPDAKPAVLLIVGVNGGGKTTTIGKLAYKYGSEGVKVLLVAGDTFRAAAAEQLAGWAERSNAQLISASSPKQRPDSLMYSAVEQAVKEETDLLICDTSGRLHTNIGLMEELAKCKRSISKRLPGAPHEVLLILDGTTGLNMLNQAREFNETVQLTGLVLTKLDGTARGGAVVSVVDELRLPIKFVGVGETVDDLQPFNAEAFVNALFPENS